VSTGDWVAIISTAIAAILGAWGLRISMRADARQEQREAEQRENRLQDRIWQLEDQLREKHGDDD
jgi:membrane protein implicated in regulation of membrane protease activity